MKRHLWAGVFFFFLAGLFTGGWWNSWAPAGSDYATANSFGYSFWNTIHVYGVPSAWDDYHYGGHPSQMTFPLFWEHLVVGLGSLFFSYVTSVKLYFFVFFALAGFSAYLFSFSLLKNRWWAVLAGLFYLFAPYHFIEVIYEGHGGIGVAYALTPLLFLAAAWLFSHRRMSFSIGLALVVAGMVLSHPQIMLVLVGPWFLVYVGGLLYQATVQKIGTVRCLGLLILSLGLSILLSGGWFFNAWADLALYRTSYSLAASARDSLSAAEALLLQPIFFAYTPSFRPLFLLTHLPYVFFLVGSIGWGIRYFWREEREEERGWGPDVKVTILCLSVFAVLSLYLSLGTKEPFGLYAFLYQYFPFFKSLRTPQRFLLMTAFSVSFLLGPFLSWLFTKVRGRFSWLWQRKGATPVLWATTAAYLVLVVFPIGHGAFQPQILSAADQEAIAFLRQRSDETVMAADLPLATWTTENVLRRSTTQPFVNMETLRRKVFTGTAPAIALAEGHFLEQWSSEALALGMTVDFTRWLAGRGVDDVVLHHRRTGAEQAVFPRDMHGFSAPEVDIFHMGEQGLPFMFAADGVVYYARPEMILQPFLNQHFHTYPLWSNDPKVLTVHDALSFYTFSDGRGIAVMGTKDGPYRVKSPSQVTLKQAASVRILAPENEAQGEELQWGLKALPDGTFPFDASGHIILAGDRLTPTVDWMSFDVQQEPFKEKTFWYLMCRSLHFYHTLDWYYDALVYHGDKTLLRRGETVFTRHAVPGQEDGSFTQDPFLVEEEVVFRRLFSEIPLDPSRSTLFFAVRTNNPAYRGLQLEVRIRDEKGRDIKLDMTEEDSCYYYEGCLYLKKDVLQEAVKRHGVQPYSLVEVILHEKNNASQTTHLQLEAFGWKGERPLHQADVTSDAEKPSGGGKSLLFLDEADLTHIGEAERKILREYYPFWYAQQTVPKADRVDMRKVEVDGDVIEGKENQRISLPPGEHTFSFPAGETGVGIMTEREGEPIVPKRQAVDYQKIAPYMYLCRISHSDAPWLYMGNSYHPGWEMHRITASDYASRQSAGASSALAQLFQGVWGKGDRVEAHFSANGGQNMWFLPMDSTEIQYYVITYAPQLRFEITGLLSLATLFGCIGAMVFFAGRKRRT